MVNAIGHEFSNLYQLGSRTCLNSWNIEEDVVMRMKNNVSNPESHTPAAA